MAKASDNPFPSVLVVEGTAPAAPSAGQQRVYLDTADHKLKRKDSAGTVTTIEGGGGGSTIVRASQTGTGSGVHTTTSTALVDTAYTVTVAATAGQALIIRFNAAVYCSAATFSEFAIVVAGTVRGGSVQSYSAAGTPTTLALGLDYVVVSGDIVGGNVTVKIQWATGAGTLSMDNTTSGAGNKRFPNLSVLNVG